MAPDITGAAAAKPDGDVALPTGARSRAYVTFLAGDGDYVKGVIGLAKGLQKAGSKGPLVVAVLPNVPAKHRRMLAEQGCAVREIKPVRPPENHRTEFAMSYYVINYSKLRIWEYSKMTYLDGDIQVFNNIDHLFDLQDGNFYAVMDCFCEKTWSHTPQNRIGYCQQNSNKVRWPEDLDPKPPLYFNAGMFVFEPDLDTYHDLLRTVRITPPTPLPSRCLILVSRNSSSDFLNMYFKEAYKPIPPVYSLVIAMLWRHPENFDLNEVKVAHYYTARSNPWRFMGKANMDRDDIKALVKKWFRTDLTIIPIFEDESLDYKNFVGRDCTLPVDLQPFLAALLEARVRDYFSASSAT